MCFTLDMSFGRDMLPDGNDKERNFLPKFQLRDGVTAVPSVFLFYKV